MNKWKPKAGEVYFIPEIKGGYPSWEDYIWRDTPRDESRYEGGIVRRSAEDALELANKILKTTNDDSMTTWNTPITAHRHIYDNGRIKCPKCSIEFVWGYYDDNEYDKIDYCPYCGQRINIIDTEE